MATAQTIESRIVDLLAASDGMLARDIAKRLNVGLQEVNQIIYGPLRDLVRRNSSYHWSLRSSKVAKKRSDVSRQPRPAENRQESRRSSQEQWLQRGADKLENALAVLASATTSGLPLNHVSILLRVAAAGDQGIDAGKLAEVAGVSPASVSRTTRTLGAVHYNKRHEGFGLVEVQFDPTDNRRRVIRLTADGRALVSDILGKL